MMRVFFFLAGSEGQHGRYIAVGVVADESAIAGAGLGEGDERRHIARARERRRPRRDGRRGRDSVCTGQVHIGSCSVHSHSLEASLFFFKKKSFIEVIITSITYM
jgi:hypothetical protein